MTHGAPAQTDERRSFYEQIDRFSMTPLWEVLDALVTPVPASPCLPHIWRYDDARPHLMKSGELITAQEAVRRVLVLENPGMRGDSCATRSLYAGLQLILPGEVAPAHRHTQSALRFVVEGRGAYTAVDGERRTMEPGDFIITPSWTWHDHGNPSDEPVVWLDGLDIPVVRFLDAGFAENLPDDTQPVSHDEGRSLTRYANNMVPVGYEPESLTSPIFAYPYAQSRATLHDMAGHENPDPAHGYKMQFINPVTGSYAMPTMATFMQLLPTDTHTTAYRSTDGTVYSVVEGSGEVEVGEGDGKVVMAFGPRDHFVVPSWAPSRFRTETDTVLFSFSDRPMQKALGLWREDRGNA